MRTLPAAYTPPQLHGCNTHVTPAAQRSCNRTDKNLAPRSFFLADWIDFSPRDGDTHHDCEKPDPCRARTVGASSGMWELVGVKRIDQILEVEHLLLREEAMLWRGTRRPGGERVHLSFREGS